jgi:hypothetical protein
LVFLFSTIAYQKGPKLGAILERRSCWTDGLLLEPERRLWLVLRLKSSPNHDAANLPTFLIITLLWLNKVMIQILCTIFTQQSNAFTDAASAQ